MPVPAIGGARASLAVHVAFLFLRQIVGVLKIHMTVHASICVLKINYIVDVPSY